MIRRQVVIPASSERVWAALTDPGIVREWFGGEFEWELTEGTPLRFRGADGADREGRIDAVRHARHLRFSWWPVGEPDNTSEVTYLIDPAGEGVRLTVQERPAKLRSSAGPAAQASVRTGGLVPLGVHSGVPGDIPRWTVWDTRLAGAWGGLGAPERLGAVSGSSLRAGA